MTPMQLMHLYRIKSVCTSVRINCLSSTLSSVLCCPCNKEKVMLFENCEGKLYNSKNQIQITKHYLEKISQICNKIKPPCPIGGLRQYPRNGYFQNPNIAPISLNDSLISSPSQTHSHLIFMQGKFSLLWLPKIDPQLKLISSPGHAELTPFSSYLTLYSQLCCLQLPL